MEACHLPFLTRNKVFFSILFLILFSISGVNAEKTHQTTIADIAEFTIEDFSFTLRSEILPGSFLERDTTEKSLLSKNNSLKIQNLKNLYNFFTADKFPKRIEKQNSNLGLQQMTLKDKYHVDLFLDRGKGVELSGFQVGKQIRKNLVLRMGLMDDFSVDNPLSQVPLLRVGMSQEFGAAAIEGGISVPIAAKGQNIIIGGPSNSQISHRQRLITTSISPNARKNRKSNLEKIRQGLPDDFYLNFQYGFSPDVKGGISLGNIDNNNQKHYNSDYLGVEGAYKVNENIEIKAGLKSALFIQDEDEKTDRNVWTEIDLKF
ncbi:hypothetical protein ACFL35_03715 [Candidatus Riflebacteria bacterium]